MRNWGRFAFPRLINGSVLAMVLLASQANAESLTRNQYATLWRNACVAPGKSSSLQLTAHEISTFQDIAIIVAGNHAAAETFGTNPPSVSTTLAKECGCFAAEIACHKKDLAAPTPDALVSAALDKCLSQPIR